MGKSALTFSLKDGTKHVQLFFTNETFVPGTFCFLIIILFFLQDCIPFLLKDGFKEIHFFGDKTFEGGNDFEIFKDERTVGADCLSCLCLF